MRWFGKSMELKSRSSSMKLVMALRCSGFRRPDVQDGCVELSGLNADEPTAAPGRTSRETIMPGGRARGEGRSNLRLPASSLQLQARNLQLQAGNLRRLASKRLPKTGRHRQNIVSLKKFDAWRKQ